jgi:hypothetical protein
MGRNSVEATKASLIRAVRARLAALTAGLTGFLGFLAVELAGLLAVGVGFVAVCVVFWAALCAVCLLAAEEACPAGLVAEPPFVAPLVDCPATGSMSMEKESKPAMQREASREMEVGEDATLISSL